MPLARLCSSVGRALTGIPLEQEPLGHLRRSKVLCEALNETVLLDRQSCLGALGFEVIAVNQATEKAILASLRRSDSGDARQNSQLYSPGT